MNGNETEHKPGIIYIIYINLKYLPLIKGDAILLNVFILFY